MRKLGIVFLLVAIQGCAAMTPPPVANYQRQFVVPADFERTWSAVVEVLSDMSFPIESISKESGLITTKMVSIGNQAGYCHCSEGLLSVYQNFRGGVGVLVRSGDNGTSFKITCHFEGFESNVLKQWQLCESRGIMERDLSSKIIDAVNAMRSTQ